MIEVIPAIIPQNLKIVREELSKVLGLVKSVQVDIIDGKYAEVVTWPFAEKNSDDLFLMSKGEKKFPYIDDFSLQVDMMVLHPIEYIQEFILMGTKSFVIHIDSTNHVKECLEAIKNSGCEVGLGIKPSVDITLLRPYLASVDFVQFMGNDRVGHSGVDLDEGVLEKIKNFHEMHPSMPIQIDIGVNMDTVPKLIHAGVTRLVSGSSIFTAPNIKEAIMSLQNS
jgi:ribulose-phosphate 3-epimerase